MLEQVQRQEQTRLNHIWVQLESEYQRGVIHLMAHMVMKLVVEQPEVRQKEAADGNVAKQD